MALCAFGQIEMTSVTLVVVITTFFLKKRETQSVSSLVDVKSFKMSIKSSKKLDTLRLNTISIKLKAYRYTVLVIIKLT